MIRAIIHSAVNQEDNGYLSAWGLHKAINSFCCSSLVLTTCWAAQKGKRGNLFASLTPLFPLLQVQTHTHTHTDSRQTAMWKHNKPTVLYLSPAEMYWKGIQVLLGLNE